MYTVTSVQGILFPLGSGSRISRTLPSAHQLKKKKSKDREDLYLNSQLPHFPNIPKTILEAPLPCLPLPPVFIQQGLTHGAGSRGSV